MKEVDVVANIISLNGRWDLFQDGKDGRWDGHVPGCVHMDLERAGVISPISWRDNEADSLWIGEEDWIYSREFEISEAQVLCKKLLLVCEGLDTLAEVVVNGSLVLFADNMYRTWRVDIKPFVHVGVNEIAVCFRSPLPFMESKQLEHPLAAWNVYKKAYAGRGYVRKMACSFGWDWGPIAVTAGIWKDIYIKAVDNELSDVRINQVHNDDASVELGVSWTVDQPVEAVVELWLRGELLCRRKVSAGIAEVKLKLNDPELWWPAGLGQQPLYDLKVSILEGDVVFDLCKKKIGLRKLELIRDDDEAGQTFFFKINNKPFFVKGANCIPADIYLPSITKEMSAMVVEAAVAANMNMLRVWGGGIFESEDFYDLCDEYGILVWQDFMFACGSYPADDDFCESIRQEAVDNVKRIRHRASIALFCGNNELEGAFVAGDDELDGRMSVEEYSKIFDKLLPDTVSELCDVPYIPGSPHSPIGDRMNASAYESGDAHLWSVWFGNQPFEQQRTWNCRFMSEFGFQSFPVLKTIESFTEPEDRNWTSYIMDYHQRSQMGNKTIFSYMLDWFRMPENFERALIMSQISQGLCLQYAVEHLRRIQPHNGGVLYWQLNDIWPAASWSTMDCFGRWKASHYIAKRFFAAEMVSVVDVTADEELADKEVSPVIAMQIHVSNQTFDEQDYTIVWKLLTTNGAVVDAGEYGACVGPQSSRQIGEVDCRKYTEKYGPRELLFFVFLKKNDQVISDNICFFKKPKHIDLKYPEYVLHISKTSEENYLIKVSSDVPSLWTRIQIDHVDASLSDNFFHLDGSSSKTVQAVIRNAPDNFDINESIRFSTII